MKKLLAFLMACIMLVSFAACGGNGDVEETTAAPEETTAAPVNGDVDEETTAAEDVTEGEEETEAEEATEEGEEATEAEDETEKEEEKTEKEEKTTKKNEKPTQGKVEDPSKWSKAEIISYASKALDKVKSEKAGYTKHAFMEVKGDVEGLPGWLVSIFQNDKTTKMAKGDNNKDDFPAAGFDWSCKLRPQDVQSAAIKVSGTTYDIMIKLGTEKNPAKGTASAYGRAVSVIDAAGAANMVPGLNSVDMTYHDGYIHVKIDSITGNITYAQLSAAADAKANVAIIGNVQAKDITSTETYTNFIW